jgi:hypothetical protein
MERYAMKTRLGFLTEEGITRRKNAARRICLRATFVFLIAGAAGYAVHRYWIISTLTPLQRVYFKQYVKASFRSYLPNSRSRYTTVVALIRNPGTTKDLLFPTTDDNVEPVLDDAGRIRFDQLHHPIFQLKTNMEGVKRILWTDDIVTDDRAYHWLKTTIYNGQSIPDIWRPAWLGAILLFLSGMVLAIAVDVFAQRRYMKGEPIRGTRALTLKRYIREHRNQLGYGLIVCAAETIGKLRKLIGLKERSFRLTVPRAEENEGLLLLGDPGTGKSQIIHQLLDRNAERSPREAIVIYDPAGEFTEQHFNPKTDVILNPLDARCPYWAPYLELRGVNDQINAPWQQFIAESFFPALDHPGSNSQFFNRSARAIFAHLLKFSPTPEQQVEILSDERLIDRYLVGTEHTQLINKDAKGQRGGVLATLSEIGESFKLLRPSEDDTGPRLSLRKWATRREGTIFITSTHTTREPLRRLQAAWINILLGCLLGDSYVVSGKRPCWVIIDEVHALKHLPILKSALVEARKYAVKIVLGTQNKAQFEEHYGRGAATMLASSHTKSFLRCNESDSARWVSEMIGEEERERPRVGTTATVQADGRDSINYSTITDRRLVVSKEQIMALPNLHGYWKYGDAVVPFRIEPQTRPQVARGFIPRETRPVTAEATKLQLKPEPAPTNAAVKAVDANGNGHDRKRAEITPEVSDELDIKF